MATAPVRKSIEIEASQAHVFRVFTDEHGAWWPLATHHIIAQPPETAIIEPRAGGRWFERATDGSECDRGRVLIWDPPGRIVLTWEISADFKSDATIETEVEVRFVSLGPARTRVELEHRGLDTYGIAADRMRDIFEGDNGWSLVLSRFAAHAAG